MPLMRHALAAFVAFLVLGTVATAARADTPPKWQWDATTPDLFPQADLSLAHGGVTYVLKLVPPKDTQGANGAKGAKATKGATEHLELGNGTWSVALTEPTYDNITGAVLAADDTRVYVASYNRISAGSRLAAYRAKDGAALWTVSLVGPGPVAHSKYYNRVQLAILDGKPVAFGSEAAARYIEVRDPDSGKLVSNTQLASEMPIRPTAESLFYEIETQLRDKKLYRIDVDDYVDRHVMQLAGHAVRAAAFADAVAHLDGVPLQHGRYKLSLKLIDTNGVFVLEARRK
jgi:hypothetical protein